MPPRRGPRWELTDRALRGLIARLDPEPSQGAEKYEALRRTLCKFFEWRGAMEPDEAADEALDRLARKIEQGEAIQDVRAYAHGVARLVLMERSRQPERRVIPIERPETLLAAPLPGAEPPMLTCLDRCLAELPEDGRAVILRYYADEQRTRIDGRRRLARELGLAPEALRNRMQRLRDRLAVCLERCTRDGEGE